MRYFIELAYDGTRYGGSQVQENSMTVQGEVESALHTFYRRPFELTGSSRTDAGVHALQNFFHVDTDLELTPQHVYNLNAILPPDIVIKSMRPVAADAHCRFLATHRSYRYDIYQHKDPFLRDRAWFYPYPLDLFLLNEAAEKIMRYEDFSSFSKRNTQVHTKLCTIMFSQWEFHEGLYTYRVTGNRFLRGMVRGLVGTMLQVGRGRIQPEDLASIIEAKDQTRADFTTPAHGLFLTEVGYPVGTFDALQ